MTLEELIKSEIENVKSGRVDERVVTFTDYKNKYAILKPGVKIKLSLTKGVEAEIDVSDYFKGAIE